MEFLTFGIIIGVGFIVSVLLGAIVAKLLGFRLNEPEYYDLQNRLKKRNRNNDTL